MSKPKGKVEFIQSHQPGFEDGDYKIEVTQNLGHGKITSDHTFSSGAKYFSVFGERFSLNPREIKAVFPPEGSLGEYSNVLPHISLNRTTIPWERTINSSSLKIPWMALLLFNEGEDTGGIILKKYFLSQCGGDNSLWSHLVSKGWISEKSTTVQVPVPETDLTGIPATPLTPDGLEKTKRLLKLYFPWQIDQTRFLANFTADDFTSGDVTARRTDLWNDLTGRNWIVTTTAAFVNPATVATSTLDSPHSDKADKIKNIFDLSRKSQVVLADQLNWNVVKFPSVVLEIAQHPNDKVGIIDVNKSLLETMIPTKDELQYMAHVRQGLDENDQPEGGELAVVIGNRMPKQGKTCTVHLVSLENRYDGNGQLDLSHFATDDRIRLVCLKSWSFTCESQTQNFKGLLENLNTTDSNYPERRMTTSNTLQLPDFNTLTIPTGTGDHLKPVTYLSRGLVPLAHIMRRGGRTVSWYRGPLIPGPNSATLTGDGIGLPARCADQLALFDPGTGMLDVSYASAWELGRLLMLSNSNVSVNLYNWKRKFAHSRKLQDIAALHRHLPSYENTRDTSGDDVPTAVATWFTRLNLLEQVPFRYLVPDERMLPHETMRFFHIDPIWMECLLDGAYSIGRVSTHDRQRDIDHKNAVSDHPATNSYGTVSGFLLRSAVVSGFPHLLVDGYSQVITSTDAAEFEPDSGKLPLIRFERLSKNVLLCLFDGDVQTVDIHQKAEAIHFGIDRPDALHSVYYKKLKNTDGTASSQIVNPIPWKHHNNKVINMNTMANNITSAITFPTTPAFSSAQFAMEMIEGAEKVRFSKG